MSAAQQHATQVSEDAARIERPARGRGMKETVMWAGARTAAFRLEVRKLLELILIELVTAIACASERLQLGDREPPVCIRIKAPKC